MADHTSGCEEIRKRLQAKLDAETSAADSREIDLHIETCVSCAQWLRMIEAENQVLAGLLGDDFDTAIDLAQLEAEVRRRIAAPRSAPVDWVVWIVSFLMAAAAVGVSTLVLSVGGLDGGAIIRNFLHDLRFQGSLPSFTAPILLASAVTALCLLTMSYALTAFSGKETSDAL
jgi:anti-sigma factor RsiW